ncbi:MAG: hypothetical protein AB7U85_07115 [Alphaproteobacteria bacterium]
MLEEKIVKALQSLNGGEFKPKNKIGFNEAKDILNDILQGKYQKENYFLNEKYEGSNKSQEQFSTGDISVFRLCAVTKLGEGVSVNLGGIVYDEPFFAVLAALNANNKEVLPVAKNYDTYKALLKKAEMGLKKGVFQSDFLSKIQIFFKEGDFIDGKAEPMFDVITIKKEQFEKLQAKGFASFSQNGSIKLFELYKNPDFK